jgi:hypothetical protein
MEYGRHVFGLEGDVELWQQHLSALQKSKQPMHVEVHDHVDGDDDNDDPPFAKIHKFQLPSMS